MVLKNPMNVERGKKERKDVDGANFFEAVKEE